MTPILIGLRDRIAILQGNWTGTNSQNHTPLQIKTGTITGISRYCRQPQALGWFLHQHHRDRQAGAEPWTPWGKDVGYCVLHGAWHGSGLSVRMWVVGGLGGRVPWFWSWRAEANTDTSKSKVGLLTEETPGSKRKGELPKSTWWSGYRTRPPGSKKALSLAEGSFKWSFIRCVCLCVCIGCGEAFQTQEQKGAGQGGEIRDLKKKDNIDQIFKY